MNVPSDSYTRLQIHASTRGLSEDDLYAIAQHVEIVRYDENDVVLNPTDAVDALYLVATGRLRLAVVSPGGQEKTVLYLGRDDQFGLLALLQGEASELKVVADHDSVLLRIPAEAALWLMNDVPLWGRNLLRALGPQIRNALLGGKQAVRKRVVALIHMTEQTREVTRQLVQQLTDCGEKLVLASDRQETLAVDAWYSMLMLDGAGNVVPVAEIRRRLAAWSDADRVILDCHISNADVHLAELIVAAEATYWLCGSEQTSQVVAEMRPLLAKSARLRDKVFAIRVLDEHEQASPLAPKLREVCAAELTLHWNGCQIDSRVCTRQAGLQRILHHLRGVSVGLALGGGAARGMAHLGVLQVFEAEGIVIDRLSGTSAGALVGIPWAAGFSADFLIDAFVTDLKPGRIYRWLPYGDAIYALLKYRLGGWDPMLRKYLNDWQLQQLAVPFSSVAVDLVAAEPVVRSVGDAATAILESINLPGISRPICGDGKALVDGGVLDVVPADVVVHQGANVVIASDVSAKIAFEFYGNRPDTPTAAMKQPSGTSALIRMRTVQDRNIRSIGGSAADFVIEPDVSKVELTDFKHADKIAELGRVAAEEALPRLKQVLHAMDPQLFPLSS